MSCKNLKRVDFKGDLARWCNVTGGCGSIERSAEIYLSGKLLEGDLVISEGVPRIEKRAFYYCEGITSIALPFSLT